MSQPFSLSDAMSPLHLPSSSSFHTLPVGAFRSLSSARFPLPISFPGPFIYSPTPSKPSLQALIPYVSIVNSTNSTCVEPHLMCPTAYKIALIVCPDGTVSWKCPNLASSLLKLPPFPVAPFLIPLIPLLVFDIKTPDIGVFPIPWSSYPSCHISHLTRDLLYSLSLPPLPSYNFHLVSSLSDSYSHISYTSVSSAAPSCTGPAFDPPCLSLCPSLQQAHGGNYNLAWELTSLPAGCRIECLTLTIALTEYSPPIPQSCRFFLCNVFDICFFLPIPTPITSSQACPGHLDSGSSSPISLHPGTPFQSITIIIILAMVLCVMVYGRLSYIFLSHHLHNNSWQYREERSIWINYRWWN